MDRILLYCLGRIIHHGSLKVITASGKHYQLGDGTGQPVTLRFVDSRAQWSFLRDPDLRLGELYMDERICVESGSIYDLVYVFIDNLARFRPPAPLRALDWIRHTTRMLRQRNFPKKSVQNVAHHYDLDSRLYRLFLDEDMQYSCAYFDDGNMPLEKAQNLKKRYICAKLAIEPHHQVLDIGCGWGGLSLYLAQVAGAKQVEGITLSKEQIKIARERAAALSMEDTVRFSLTDYRDITNRFERIVSVGMFEHVGCAFYDTFFAKCRSLLTEDGVMLLHTIGCSDTPGFVTPWLDKYIFPGGYIPSLSEIIPAIERAGLIVADVEVLQMHYALTLREWRVRFLARRDQARDLYDDRFCRMWEFYLAAAEVAFRCENLVVFQILLSKKAGAVARSKSYVQAQNKKLAGIETSLNRAEE